MPVPKIPAVPLGLKRDAVSITEGVQPNPVNGGAVIAVSEDGVLAYAAPLARTCGSTSLP
jgi:hypothetical protein